MFLKTVFCLAVLFVLVAAGPLQSFFVTRNPLQTWSAPRNVPSISMYEEPCVLRGGVCLRIENCEPGNLVQIGDAILCPAQRHLGAECCYN